MGLRPNAIYQGDCIKHLREIEPGSIDLVFADPPFNIGYEYDTYDDRRNANEYLDWCRKWISGVAAALKPNGTFWLAIGDEFAAELKLIAQNDAGFHCRSWVIWYYTFGVNCVRGFSRSHTHLFHFVKDPHDFTFNADNPAVRVPSARQLVYADARANPKGRLPDNTWIYRPQDVPPGGFAPAHDTWYYARVAGTFKEREGFHGCQMPEQLLGRIIRVSSNPQGLVFDPFSGSGTTLVVAKKLGRRWMGTELSKDYAKRIQDRLDRTKIGATLDGPENPVQSAPKTSEGKRTRNLRNRRPTLGQDSARGIIDAYRKSSKGNSTDVLICDPELNAEFISACRKAGIPGDAALWNQFLLRIRKAGNLPKTTTKPRRLSARQMDSYSFASEMAMRLVAADCDQSLDAVLCSPVLSAQFDQLAAKFAPGFSSFEYRWAALAVRKRAMGRKRLAEKWVNEKLPRNMSVERCLNEDRQLQGVYVLSDANATLFVGASFDLRQQIQRIMEIDFWSDLEVTANRLLPTSNESEQNGLQSLLIQKHHPSLNLPLQLPKQLKSSDLAA